jgi:CRISPR-associated protein Cst2
MKRGLTFTTVFQANSLNYGESIANISELKKFHRGNGDVHTYASRQSLRYDIVRLGNELFGWNLDTVHNSNKVIQFKKNVTIRESVEMDLFGYLKTDAMSQKRPAVARLSHAISLEPYKNDLDFLINLGLSSRIDKHANIANIEEHQSLYTYTLTLDLSRVGKDGEIELSQDEKFERVQQLLDILKILNRHIRGRQENLSPLFVVGGVYNIANPFFLGRVRVSSTKKGWEIDIDPIESTFEQTFAGQSIGEQTRIGLVKGLFANEDVYREKFGEHVLSVEQFFDHLKKEMRGYYGV